MSAPSPNLTSMAAQHLHSVRPRRSVPQPAPAPEVRSAIPVQASFEDLGVPLHEVTFVVVDLETTGSSPGNSAITEIGAVKVRGGEVLGEFQTLVNPGVPVPAMISVLTGITTAMVVQAPPIAEVLPSFLEFAHGAVLVAHNAGFDIGFLKAAARSMDLTWPAPQVLDTVRLARKVVTRDEAPNHKLATLAGLFGASVTPEHRALADARATVDVLHALLARMAPLGVTHLEDLATATDPVPAARRRKSSLADALPNDPGVYQFIGPDSRVLYIGTAANLRRRVRSYFTAAEKRSRIGEMVDLATAVHPIICATTLEAQVRELRLIAEHKPAYNRRSRSPERAPWLRLTEEAHPRLSIVRSVPLTAADRAIGPFPSRRAAQEAQEMLQSVIGLRTCTARLPREPSPGATACVLAELGRCSAPCVQVGSGYTQVADDAARVMAGAAAAVVVPAHRTIARLSREQRYEEAAVHRDRLAGYLRGAARSERLAPLRGAAQAIAARPRPGGGWEIMVMRYGRLAASGDSRPGSAPMAAVQALVAGAEHVPEPRDLSGRASAEETELLATWLEQDGTRLIEWRSDSGQGWAMPLAGASRFRGDLGAAAARDPRFLETVALGPSLSDPIHRDGRQEAMMEDGSRAGRGPELEETC